MNYQEYLQSDHWQTMREIALNIHGRRCAACGYWNDLNVHHKHYRSLWNEDPKEDLMVLCSHCHEQTHWYLENFIETDPEKEFSLIDFIFIAMTTPWCSKALP